MPVAMLTGFTGQDGSYLAELLLEKGYQVHAIVRRSGSLEQNTRVAHLLDRVTIHSGDLSDAASIDAAIGKIKPHEFYNLAAMSHVGTSFQQPYLTAHVTGIGPVHCLDAIRRYSPQTRFYQASSSEMFGAAAPPQNENTPFLPQSPYAAAKAYAHYMTRLAREAYGVFACCGICFNHESERRGAEFVTRKITRAAARIRLGLQDKLHLGDIRPKRDWGYAPEYVDGMWRMMQQDKADDYVLATGQTYSVQDFLAEVFKEAGLTIGYCVETDCAHLRRAAEVPALRGDASKARQVLGWRPQVDMPELARRMYHHDLQAERVRRAA